MDHFPKIRRLNATFFIVFLSFFIHGNFFLLGQEQPTGLRVMDYTVSPDASMDSVTVSFTIETEEPLYNSLFVFHLVEDTIISIDKSNTPYLGFVRIDTIESRRHIATRMAVSQYFSPGNYQLFTTNYFASSQLDNRIIYGNSSFKVLPSPMDLQWVNINIISDELNPGFVNKISYRLKKNGNILVTSVPVDFYLSNDLNFNRDEDIYLGSHYPKVNFNYGTSYIEDTIGIPSLISEGQYHLFCMLDPGKIWDDTNETNNLISVPVQVKQPDIDLMISYVTSSEVDDTTWSAEIQFSNIGSSHLFLKHTTAYYLSKDPILDTVTDILIGSFVHSDSLPNSKMSTISFSFTEGYVEGEYYLILKADHLHEITETNESNNIYIKQINSDVDLVLINPYIPDPIITHNYQVPVPMIVRNNGKITSPGFTIQYQLTNPSIWDILDESIIEIDSLQAGEEREVVYNFSSYGEAVYYVNVNIDRLNQVFEDDEDNNHTEQKIVYYKITGNEEEISTAIKISPMPAQEEFLISNINISEPIHYTILNTFGEIVWENELTTNTDFKVICNDWTKGIYILKAEWNGNHLQKKIIIY